MQLLLWFTLIPGGHTAFSQPPDPVRWLTFEQLDDSLKVHPKKVFVEFYADWCTYCRKMDKEAFQEQQVAALLNDNYYAVRMNIETPDHNQFWQPGICERENQQAQSCAPDCPADGQPEGQAVFATCDGGTR